MHELPQQLAHALEVVLVLASALGQLQRFAGGVGIVAQPVQQRLSAAVQPRQLGLQVERGGAAVGDEILERAQRRVLGRQRVVHAPLEVWEDAGSHRRVKVAPIA